MVLPAENTFSNTTSVLVETYRACTACVAMVTKQSTQRYVDASPVQFQDILGWINGKINCLLFVLL